MRDSRTRARVVSNYVEQNRLDVYSAKSLGGHNWVLGAGGSGKSGPVGFEILKVQ